MSEPILDLDLDTLRRRTSAKWVVYEPDVIPAWVAEMDVRLAAPVRSAIGAAIDLGDTGYPRPPQYVAAFTGFAERQWGWAVPQGQTALVPDVMMGILVLLLQVTSEGDTVVIDDPVYPPFAEFPVLAGRRVLRAPMTEDGRLDPAALDAAFAEATRGGRRAAYLLCNPHNPTGSVPTLDELTMVAATAERHGVSVISDEIHAPIVYAPHRFVPYLEVPGLRDGFAVHSAAKTFSLAGLKAGLVVAAPAGGPVLKAIAHGPNASLSGVIAQSAAWAHGDAWAAQLVSELDANRHRVLARLAEKVPGIRARVPDGTYLLWLDCRALGLPGDPAAYFLEHARVAMNSGPTFGPAGVGHARLNLATSPAILDEIVDRIAASLPG